MMLVYFEPGAVSLQNRLPPQRTQKPRSALSDERYQRSVAESVKCRFSEATWLAATKCPLVFRHCEQWQAITSRSGALVW